MTKQLEFRFVTVVPAIIILTFTEMVRCHGQKSDEENLLNYLFNGYNPSARPVMNSTRTVAVNLQFSLLQIQELNVRSQVLTTTGVLILDWKDERLSWTKELSNLEEIVVYGVNIWRPEFAVINGAESVYGEYAEFQATLRSDGRIRWEPGGVFKTMCSIDITYYPFDEQHCELIFGAWSYYTTKMNLTTDNISISLHTYETNGEWEITKTSAERKEFHFECCPHQRFSNIVFSIELRRRHTFYVMNVILPGILTSAVLLSIFFCVPSQKVHIGVAALLSFRLFLVNVADTIPRTSDHVPLLGIYLTCTMAITTLAMVATVFVGNLYNTTDKPVPIWIKRIFMVYVARILCMTCDCEQNERAKKQNKTLTKNESENNIEKFRIVTLLNIYADDHRRTPKSHSSMDGEDRSKSSDLCTGSLETPRLSRSSRSKDGFSPSVASFPRGLQRASMTPTVMTSSKTAEPLKRRVTDFAADWAHVASVCDRLFFWLCLLFIIVTTLLLFHPLTTFRYFKIPVIDKQN